MISPVLANMFLDHVFDMWMKRNFPQAPFERYADDGVVHCSTKEEALYIKERLAKRFEDFKAVHIKCRDGVMRYNFIASVGKTVAKNFRDKIKAMEIHKKTGGKIDMIDEMLDPMIRGWINYFGKFKPTTMKYTLQCIKRRLVKWPMCKYKNHYGHSWRAEKWLSSIIKREPKLFAHWGTVP